MLKNKDLFDKACEKIKQGETVSKACNAVGLGYAAYYGIRSKLKASERVKLPKNKFASKKRTSKITVHDLPVQIPSQAFIVFGNAQVLAEFARNYQ